MRPCRPYSNSSNYRATSLVVPIKNLRCIRYSRASIKSPRLLLTTWGQLASDNSNTPQPSTIDKQQHFLMITVFRDRSFSWRNFLSFEELLERSGNTVLKSQGQKQWRSVVRDIDIAVFRRRSIRERSQLNVTRYTSSSAYLQVEMEGHPLCHLTNFSRKLV